MPATVTLSTTTLSASSGATDDTVSLASTDGVLAGTRLYMDREMLEVRSLVNTTRVSVVRGLDGTPSTRHANGAQVTIGTPDQFYLTDPPGMPPSEVLVSPWINILTGVQWTAQGDEEGPGLSSRWWARTTATHGTGPLGVRTTTTGANADTIVQ